MSHTVKLVTWNVNGLRAILRKNLQSVVETLSPDILCLQEIKAFETDIPASVRSLGYSFYCYHSAVRKGYSGVALFHNQPNWICSSGLGIEKYDLEGRLVWCETPKVRILNFYFPNGSASLERHLFKQNFLKDLYEWVKAWKTMGAKPLVIVGDWNIAPDEKDVWDPVGLQNVSGFLPEERLWFKQFLELGYVDVWRYFYPDRSGVFTWWSYKEFGRKGNRGWRIDHVVVDKSLLTGVKNVTIYDQIEGSDHCPVSVEFEPWVFD